MNAKILLAAAVAALLLIASLHAPPRPPSATPISLAPPLARPKHRNFAVSRELMLVYVAGAVVRRGLYRLPGGARADDAVRAAGGFAPSADPAGVNLASRIADGDEVFVPQAGQSSRASGRSRLHAARTRRRKARAPAQPLDLNVAGADELASLPGVGPALAQRIVRFREVNGRFSSVDELADVAGMTQRRVDALARYVQVHDEP